MTSLDPGHFPTLPTTGEKAVYKPSHQRNSPIHIPPIPDLRFEQSYLRTIAPFLHVQKQAPSTSENPQESSSSNQTEAAPYIDWGKIIWITSRDQILSPLIQGALWGFASQWLIPSIRNFGGRIGSLLFQPSKDRASRQSTKDGAAIERLRKWSRGLTQSAETNAII